ncbi:hypothetical protein [Wenzhouxiangella sp. EGI_FJ10409]|uniref:hypothetical protein n=1 Tax=Wenzhouxiangella sp. EGI_FJ10409 TaxID=3243767 RepID=UPI0035E3919D
MHLKKNWILGTGLLLSTAVIAVQLSLVGEVSAAKAVDAPATSRAGERVAAHQPVREADVLAREQLWTRERQAAPEPNYSEWNDAAARGTTVSVGPGCDYENLQDAIDDAVTGSISGEIGIHKDYQASGPYVIIPNGSGLLQAWLMGGFPDCNVSNPDNTSGRTTLSVTGGGRPITVSYNAGPSDPFSAVLLENLVLTGGDTQLGGGLRVVGRPGLLTTILFNTEVSGNQAGSGGGIQLSAPLDWLVPDPTNPPLPMLFLDDNSHVIDNVASNDGGGIWCGSNAERDYAMTLVRSGSGLIFSNEAERGGGVFLSGCSFALRNGGPTALIVPAGGVSFNTASVAGGGVYAENSASGSISALSSDEFGGDPESAGIVANNEAPEGGGIFATGDDTNVFGIQAYVVDNTATGTSGAGGGIQVEEGALVHFIAMEGTGACTPRSSSGGVTTAPPCNRLEDNHAEYRGGAAQVLTRGRLIIERAYIRGNTSVSEWGEIIDAFGGVFSNEPVEVDISNSLIAGNGSGGIMLHADTNSDFTVRWSTVVDNDVGDGASLFHVRAPGNRETVLNIYSSIVWDDDDEAMVITTGDGDVTAAADCVIGYRAVEDTDLTNVSYYSQIDPEFQDAGAGDYRPGPSSPAIDYCDDYHTPPDRDLDDRARGESYPNPITAPPDPVPNGIYDLGAFVIVIDRMFSDRFEP